MKFLVFMLSVQILAAAGSPMSVGQQEQGKTETVVPKLVSFSAVVKDAIGKPLSGNITITFSLYSQQEGGSPLWSEMQTVQADSEGKYTVFLGAANGAGLPLEAFTSGAARWLAVRPDVPGMEEMSRVLLVGVPYALKAADADTLGGKPASAFVMVESQTGQASGSPNAVTPTSVALIPEAIPATTPTGSGTVNYIPLWTSATNLGNSLFSQGSGYVKVGGIFEMPAIGTATASKGYDSQPFYQFASAYNSSTNAAVVERFSWQAEPVGNNTASPSGQLNLLFASGIGAPAETGLSISNTGVITFAPGQTLPAVTGNETVSGTLSAGQLYSQAGSSAVEGKASNDADFAAGVVGVALGSTKQTIGVEGITSSPTGTGIYGGAGSTSSTGMDTEGYSGVWADTSLEGGSALTATTDDGYAGLLVNNSQTYRTLWVQAEGASQIAYFESNAGSCSIANAGSLSCTGTKSAVVPVDNGTRKVALYAVESPENWFEDFGSGHLTDGKAIVRLEATFGQTVNAGISYHVFITPRGESKGLYVNNATAEAFEVHEVAGGQSNIEFDYRIVARRKGYEAVRLADKTKEFERVNPRVRQK